MPFWKSKKNPLQLPPVQDREDFAAEFAHLSNLMVGEQKSFDWNHYQSVVSGASSGMFQSEFQLIPTMRVIKAMLLQEPGINSCVHAIAKQFQGPRLMLKKRGKKDQEQTVYNHPFLEYYRKAGSSVEGWSSFTSNGISDLITCGNAYWWTSPDGKEKRRLPAERVEPTIVNNRIVSYRIMDRTDLGFTGLTAANVELPVEEITHITLPNPFSPHIGLSMLVAISLPVLIDKYGREYIVAFFVRGGNTSGIIQTQTNDMGKLIRLMKTIMQAFGGRKNMHADKILPKDAEWKGASNSFRDINLLEMLKSNAAHFRAATGCTNTVLSQVENINRATAFAEMELFWLQTILPMQKLWCTGIMSSPVWKQFKLDETWELCFDNSEVIYLDDFDRRLDQDAKLASTWTINERRERLGKEPMEGYDLIQFEMTAASNPFMNLSLPTKAQEPLQIEAPAPIETTEVDPLGKWKAEESQIQEPTKPTVALFKQEFQAWLNIVLDNLESESNATTEVEKRAKPFAEDYSKSVITPAMRAYDNQMKQTLSSKSAPAVRTKENEEDRKAKLEALRLRARELIAGNVYEDGRKSFVGYSNTAMKWIYQFIAAQLESGASLPEVASRVRSEFNASYGMEEAYPGQAETIVRTEFGAAISIAQAQFGYDLVSVTEEMTKSWVTMGDEWVRDSCLEAAQHPISGKSSVVFDAAWENGLRYPRESGGEAEHVINCRCTIRYAVDKWS